MAKRTSELEPEFCLYSLYDENFYPKVNENDLSDAIQAAKDFIILIKNEQIKKREAKLNEDFND